MSEFNTFTGKTVDDAIVEACRFFTVERDRLEVEIITGGSTGIFGLVGKKKAQIRARRRQDPAVAALLEQEAKAAMKAEAAAGEKKAAPSSGAASGQRGVGRRDTQRQPQPQRQERRDQPPATQAAPAAEAESAEAAMEARPAQQAEAPRENSRKPRGERPSRPQKPREPRPERPRREQPAQASGGRSQDGPSHDLDDDLPEGQDHSPASPELIALAGEIMSRLLTPILEQEPRMEIEGTGSRLSVRIQDEEHSGLLIGREGQTLAALQYLANRILARRWENPVRVQINTGEYREKQDDNLRRMALYLADKARNLGRPQSTKPLSSYHRRVIHLALQGDESIQTRSKGDGPMKRVIIVPKRPKGEVQAQ